VTDGVRYSTNASGDWKSVTVDDGAVGNYPDFIVDESGVVHIFYGDVGNERLLYAVGDIGGFDVNVIENLGENFGLDEAEFTSGQSAIVVQNGAVYIAFENYGEFCLSSFHVGWEFE